MRPTGARSNGETRHLPAHGRRAGPAQFSPDRRGFVVGAKVEGNLPVIGIGENQGVFVAIISIGTPFAGWQRIRFVDGCLRILDERQIVHEILVARGHAQWRPVDYRVCAEKHPEIAVFVRRNRADDVLLRFDGQTGIRRSDCPRLGFRIRGNDKQESRQNAPNIPM